MARVTKPRARSERDQLRWLEGARATGRVLSVQHRSRATVMCVTTAERVVERRLAARGIDQHVRGARRSVARRLVVRRSGERGTCSRLCGALTSNTDLVAQELPKLPG